MTTVQLTSAESASLHRLVSTEHGRKELYAAFADSYGRVGHVGTGPVARTGTTQLDVSWGFSGAGGQHFWIIASYADVLSGALQSMTPACVAGLSRYIGSAASPVCNYVIYVLKNLAYGQPSLSNHGVWAAVYFWPFRVTGGTW